MKEKFTKRTMSLILSICLLVSTIFFNSTVVYAGSDYLPQGYVTDSNGIMAYYYNTVTGENGSNYSDYYIKVTLTGKNCIHKNKTKIEKIDATCVEIGMKEYWICDLCNEILDKDGRVITDESSLELPMDPHNHIGDTIVKDSKAATCTEKGYTGDIYCESCVGKIQSGEEIPAKDHTFGDYKSNKDATTKKDGSKTRACSECGYKDTVTDEGSKLPSKEKGTINIPKEKEKDNFGSGELSGLTNDIKNAILTVEDKKAISQGKDIEIWLEVKDASLIVSDIDKKAVEKIMPNNFSLGSYLDINLWKQTNGSDATKVKELPNGKIEITITIPKELQKPERSFGVIRVHDKRADLLDAKVDSKNKLTFETDCFSTYAIIYQDKSSQDNDKDTTVPNTGDTNDVWFCYLLMMAALGAFGFTMFYDKRIQRKKDN